MTILLNQNKQWYKKVYRKHHTWVMLLCVNICLGEISNTNEKREVYAVGNYRPSAKNQCCIKVVLSFLLSFR